MSAQSDEETSYRLVRKARDYINAGEARSAFPYLHKAHALTPQSSDVHLKLADAYFQIDEFKNSIKECDLVLALHPNSADAYYRRGTSKSALNMTSAALADICKAISLAPTKSKFLMVRAELFLALKNYDGAVSDLHRFLIVDTSKEKVHTVYLKAAECRKISGNRVLERLELSKLVKYDPSCVDAYRLRADSFFSDGDYKQAEQECIQALAIEPDNEHCLQLRKKIGQLKAHLHRAVK